jgi:hypothetical protein
MRTFEALGARTKLITTNHSVKNYDFYNPVNICIIDRGTSEIPQHFINSDYDELKENVYTRYSVSGWLDEVLREPLKNSHDYRT